MITFNLVVRLGLMTSRFDRYNIKIKDLMTRIKIHISNVKLPFYPLCEVKYRLQNGVLTFVFAHFQFTCQKNKVAFVFLELYSLIYWSKIPKIVIVQSQHGLVWETVKIWVPLKKERFLECFLGHLSFWINGMELPLIFL